jgi:hypothetical protein
MGSLREHEIRLQLLTEYGIPISRRQLFRVRKEWRLQRTRKEDPAQLVEAIAFEMGENNGAGRGVRSMYNLLRKDHDLRPPSS